MDNRPCYGNYGRKTYPDTDGGTAEVGNCGKCGLRSWCRDAGDIKPEDHVELGKVEFSEQCAVQPDCADTVPECAKCAIAMAKCVHGLCAMRDQSPLRFHVVMSKLSNPEMAYSQIAAKFAIQKQLVQYHLRVAISIFPELGRAILVNRKYNPGKEGVFRKAECQLTLNSVIYVRRHKRDTLTPFLPGFDVAGC